MSPAAPETLAAILDGSTGDGIFLTAPIPGHASDHQKGSFLHPAHLRATFTARYSEERRRLRADKTLCSGCVAKKCSFEKTAAEDIVAAGRLQRQTPPKPTKYGVIYSGSTQPAMDEAIAPAGKRRGIQIDRLGGISPTARSNSSVASLFADHDDFVYVYEKNRDRPASLADRQRKKRHSETGWSG